VETYPEIVPIRDLEVKLIFCFSHCIAVYAYGSVQVINLLGLMLFGADIAKDVQQPGFGGAP
jgi:hypothetical protein